MNELDSLLLDTMQPAHRPAQTRIDDPPERVREAPLLLVTPKTAAEMLSISEKSLRLLVRSKKLKVKKIGRCRRFRVADLEKFAASK